MRLICPNCDAQYEVDDNVIPKDGRDVQCSSCEQTWFQESAAQQEEALAAAPTPHKPDKSAMDVLREEAERETKARIDEAQTQTEAQPEPDPDQADDELTPLAATIRKHMAHSKEVGTDKGTAHYDLPDIEELNSTLRAKSDDIEAEKAEAVESPQQSRRGFRIGFGLVLTIAMLMLLAYANAPMIIEILPQSESYMIDFVRFMNDLWQWLDQMMKTATQKMSGGGAGS